MEQVFKWVRILLPVLSCYTAAFGQSVGTGPNLYYGPGINADALGNTRVGGPEGTWTGWRFLSTHTGNLVSFKHYVIWSTERPGYSGGDGGTLQYELRTDDGTSAHFPSDTVLASVTLNNPISRNFFPTLTWPAPVLLNEGTIYHIVCKNRHADPVNNYVSLDNLFAYASTHPVNPTTVDKNWAVLLLFESGGWRIRDGETPILELQYSDGFRAGQGYMEVWVGNPKAIGGSNAVRELFTVTGGDKLVSQVSVRMRRVSGTGALTMTLERSNGTAEEAVTVLPNAVSRSYAWVTFPFTAPRKLREGVTYHLKLSAPSGSVYDAYPLADGSVDYEFDRRTVFSEGLAQFTTGGAWTGWDQWGETNRQDADLQFYFTLERPLVAPTVLWPIRDARLAPDSVALRWSRPSGAGSYQVQVAVDSFFARNLVDSVVTDTLWRAPTYLDVSQYFARVRALGAGLGSPYSVVRSFFIHGPLADVEIAGEKALAFQLYQNYPNPFNPKTVVSSQLPVASHVRLVVYDLLGREVAVLADEWRAAGSYQDTFSAGGGDGSRLSSGVYIYRLTGGPFVESRKMILVK